MASPFGITLAFKITRGVQNPLGTREDYINVILFVSISIISNEGFQNSLESWKNSSNENENFSFPEKMAKQGQMDAVKIMAKVKLV